MSMRHVSIALGIVLVLMFGGILGMLAIQRPLANVSDVPPGPTPTPVAALPTAGATALAGGATPPPVETSPSQPTPAGDGRTGAPAAAPRATTQPADTVASPAPIATAAAPPPPVAASAPPSASPQPTPVAPTREITFSGLGLDSATSAEEATTPRFVTFTAQGPGQISVLVSQATGRVRACLWRGDSQSVVDEECRTLRRGEISREVSAGDAAQWTLSLIGADPAGSPSTTLRLRFPTDEARVHLAGFRFQGEANEHYNGFTAEFGVASDGEIAVVAAFDDGVGGTQPYRLVIQEVGGGPAQTYLAESEAGALDERIAASAERSYSVALENRDFVADELVLLTVDLDWP